MGEDIISKNELLKIEEFNEKTDLYFNQFNEEKLSSQKYGIYHYNRKAYQQGAKYNKKAIINFFSDKNSKNLEEKVIEKFK